MIEISGSNPGSRPSDWSMLYFILIYNTILTLGLVLLSPLLLTYVMAKGKRRQTFRYRMGWTGKGRQCQNQTHRGDRIWVHALSVGEVLSAQPLVNALKAARSDGEIIFTASTLTGYQTACELFTEQSIQVGFFPYDWIWPVRKVISRINPSRVIIVETDIWPTVLWELKRRGVPVYLVNLRISDSSWKSYRRFKWAAGKVYSIFDRICVQTRKEMVRLDELGIPAERISVCGNFKFDSTGASTAVKAASAWRNCLNIKDNQRLVVAGSTHAGEEAMLFEAIQPFLSPNAETALVVAPRDPQRGSAITSLCRKFGLNSALLSHLEQQAEIDAFPQVIVVDSIGKLRELYGLACFAFVGGSMVPHGGHNPLEPASWGKPVLFGRDMRDFSVIADDLIEAGGALRISDTDHLRRVFDDLFGKPDKVLQMGKKALGVLLGHQGAVERALAFLALDRSDPLRSPTRRDTKWDSAS